MRNTIGNYSRLFPSVPYLRVISREGCMERSDQSKRDRGCFRVLTGQSEAERSGLPLTLFLLIAAVMACLLVTPAMAAPTLTLSPSSGRDGAWVTAIGSSFPSGGDPEFPPPITIRFNNIEVASNYAWGSFSIPFQVPAGTPHGTYTVQAIMGYDVVHPTALATATFTVISPPFADFTLDPGRGRAPLTVYFTDRSTGYPTSWWWNFGDGSTSSAQHPNHQYVNPGIYTVTLTVSNAAGSSSNPDVVMVYKPAITLSPSYGKAGSQVTVTGNSFDIYTVEDPQGTITFNGAAVGSTFRFIPESGEVAEQGSFTTSFTVPVSANPGDYTVRVIGPRDSVEATFTVTNTAPRALIDANPLSGKIPLDVHFSGTRSYDEDGSIDSFWWSFGDGTTATGATADHTYTSPGDYTATLTVTDNQKSSGTASVIISIANTPPVAVARADTTSGSDPLTVNFDGSQSYDPDGTIRSYHWSFGDDTWERTARAQHIYQNLQQYTAVLTVTDDRGMTATDEIIITVGNEPPVAILAASPKKGTMPLSVTVNALQSHDPDDTDLTYAWDFGDGSSGSEVTTGHTYEKEGTYRLSLVVTDPHGASDMDQATIEVEQPFPWLVVLGGIVLLGGGMVTLRHFRKPPGPPSSECRIPEPEVHVKVESGLEYSAGLARRGGELPDISVEIRSGIWKEGDER